jgi:hypothetical protein
LLLLAVVVVDLDRHFCFVLVICNCYYCCSIYHDSSPEGQNNCDFVNFVHSLVNCVYCCDAINKG